ncbi:protein timeless homolog [Periplaneta americana]|uniref:protein timeless homolog n=1 Tax=Periplaneta americana TaxID=6978 RepID=UPI0037E91260
MSSLLYAELAATCNALGYYDGNKYYIDTYCQETVKDLIRYLRRDDENHEIRRHLGEAKILQSDLLPILKDYWDKVELFDVILRLLVNLTNPALLLYREELPAEKTSRNYYLQIITNLQSYKEAFCDDTVWAILSKKLGDILQIDSMEREEDKGLVIERILILVRNVLQVPADPEAEKRTDNDASVHDQLLWALHQSGMVDLFLYIACSENEQQYYMHILEIVSLMLREQNPSQLADASISRSVEEKERDEVELLAIREQEIRRRQEKVKKFTGARHSRFGGTYVLKDMKSISDNDLIYHKPLNKLDSLDFDHDKVRQRTPKNRLPMKVGELERRSAFSIRLFLKKFCVEFLNGAYNTLMYHVKDGLVRAKAQANDESYYLWAMKFFMEFNRNYKFQVKLVSETMSVQTFHFVQTQLENCYDMMTSDKKKLLLWSRRMHLALRAYQELLMTFTAMDRSDDPTVQESSKVIKSNIFYVVEYRELILTLLVNYDEIKFTKAYLKDLIETAHIFLKLLEHFCSNRSIVVQKRRVVRKRKTKKSNVPEQTPQRNPQELWDEVGPQLSAVLQNDGTIPTDIVPFDAASEKSMDEQKVDAMCKIQTHLRNHQFEEAVGLLRSAREVWPENDSFGNANMAPEEEFEALRDIFMADIQNPEQIEAATENGVQNDEEEEDEEEQQVANISVGEQDFKFMDFANRFAHHRVVQACSILLKQFEKNLAHTNHCIAKMLHRIAWDCKLPAMLFQASLFRTFQRILDSKQSQHKELAKFAIYVVRQFTEVAKVNGKVYMELLFWKTARDAFDIEQGYGSYQEKTHSSKQAWSEEEEEELRRLYQEYTNRTEAEDAEGGGDVVDWILQNLINTSRSHRGVAKKLRELGYVVAKKTARKTGNVRPSKTWAEEEEQQLMELYEEFKDAIDPLGCIIDRLRVRRPKPRIAEKLLELGMVQDKKELRKKRVRKSRGPSFPDALGWESAESDGADSDEDAELDDDDSEPDEDTTSNTPRPSSTQQQQRPQYGKPSSSKKTTASKKKRTTPKPFSSAELASILTQVISSGMSEALLWISSSMEEVAEDRDTEEDEEGIPLLPLTEDAMNAMDNPQFLNLLKALSIVPPSDEQEAYWRIPANLSASDLRKRVEVIHQALEGRLTAPDNDETNMTAEELQDIEIGENANVSTTNDTHSKEKEEAQESEMRTKEKKKHKTEKPKKKAANSNKSSKRIMRNSMMDTDSETDNISHHTDENLYSEVSTMDITSGNSKTKLRNAVDSDSETEEISLSSLIQRNRHSNKDTSEKYGHSSGANTHKSRKIALDSDSENEDDKFTSQKTKNKLKRVLNDSDSDNEDNTTFAASLTDDPDTDSMKKRLLDDDAEEPTEMTKRRRIIMSDDEDD